MKNKLQASGLIAIVLIALVPILIGISNAYALPDETVNVNGRLFNPDFYFARPDVPHAKPREGNVIALEIKAKWVEGQLLGSGSLHGINCHSTFFFNNLVGDIDHGTLTLTGTVTSTSTPFAGWIGTPVELVTDLEGSDMHFIIMGFIDFAGSGNVVL